MQRILFTGLGSIGRRHARLLQQCGGDFEIHAYRSGETNTEAPQNIHEHNQLDSALATDPDIAFITNPTNKHVETALSCARNGCHLFIEKPLSHTMEGIEKLIEVVERHNLITYIGCQLRFHPVLKRIRTLLANEMIGDVFSYRAYAGSYLPDWRQDQDYRASYSSDPEKGGGVVLDLIHEFDYAYWLFGEVSHIQSWTGNVSELDIEAEDLAEIILEMDTGVVGELHLDYYRPEPRRTIEIIGSDGIIHGDLNEGELTVKSEEQMQTKEFEFERDKLFIEQLEHFLDNVRSGTSCNNDLREGKQVLNIALRTKGEL